MRARNVLPMLVVFIPFPVVLYSFLVFVRYTH